MNGGPLAQRRSALFGLILAVTVAFYAFLTIVAGLPPGETTGFVVGLLVLFAVTVGVGVAAWYLMLRPLPAGTEVRARSLSSTRERHVVALLLSLAALSFGIAGVWDEVWHTKYGVPFGMDFFWRPHLLLYFSFTCVIGVGLWGWWLMMRRGRGTLQQRFRTDPILGVSFLLAAYTLYAISADPVWHWMYGADIAPWSVPHLLILTLMLFTALLAVGYHRSVMSRRIWSSRISVSWRDVLISLVFVGVLMAYLLIFTIQWYSAATNAELMAEVRSYPDWLLTVFVTFLATMFGTVVLHATRRVGTATLFGLLTLGVRFLLDTSLDSVRPGTLPLWLFLPVLLGLDVWYGTWIQRTGRPPAVWTTAGVTVLTSSVVGLPVMAALFEHPPVTAATVPGMVIASALAATAGVGLGRLLSAVGETAETAETTETAEASREKSEPERQQVAPPRLAMNLVYAAYLLFMVLFVTTAAPPVG